MRPGWWRRGLGIGRWGTGQERCVAEVQVCSTARGRIPPFLNRQPNSPRPWEAPGRCRGTTAASKPVGPAHGPRGPKAAPAAAARERGACAQRGAGGQGGGRPAAAMQPDATEHSPLTRLAAILYFMGSSMLVQYTTKVCADPATSAAPSGAGGAARPPSRRLQRAAHCNSVRPGPSPRRRCSPTLASTTR